ncbi:MAG: NAD(P)/FAD-dependent oxidoreductase, partial [Acholeplasma sp.]
MEQNVNILVIGGSAAGLVAAMTAKANHQDKRVMMIRKEEKVMIPCGIPYIFGTLEHTDQNILPDAGLINLGVEIVLDVVLSIDPEGHYVTTEKGNKVTYDRLVITTGSIPIKPS